MGSEVKSLKILSYANILVNFSRHVYAYATTGDENLKRNFDFLQRVYSNSLLRFICKKQQFCERGENILDFLCNENLKELIINDNLLRLCDAETLLQKVTSIAHCLKSISFEEPYLNDGDFKHISKVLFPRATNVVQVNIPYKCKDEIIKIIAFSCTGLKVLDIHNSFVTGAGIKTLCLNPDGSIRATSTLQSLDVLNVPLEIEDVAFLVHNIPTLEVLNHSQLPYAIEYLYSSDKVNKAEKYNFKVLDLEYTRLKTPSLISDCLTAWVEKCPNVELIKIGVYNVEQMQLLSQFSKVHSLYIENKYLGNLPNKQFDLSFNSLLICIGKGIRYMSVYHLSLSVSVLIENCPNLENLYLKIPSFQDFDEKSEGLLRKMHTLSLLYNFFEKLNTIDSVMKLLHSSENLENLVFYNCRFENSDLISKLLDFSCKSNLKSLYFEYSMVEISFLEQFILNCSSLKTLTLKHCEPLYSVNISSLQKTVEAANRKVEIFFTCIYSEEEDYSMSCFGLELYPDGYVDY